jgi:hypothetical protein
MKRDQKRVLSLCKIVVAGMEADDVKVIKGMANTCFHHLNCGCDF